MDRRKFLYSTGAAGVTLTVAGCAEDEDPDDADEQPDDDSEGADEPENDEVTDDEADDDETDDETTDDEAENDEPEEADFDSLLHSSEETLERAMDRFDEELEQASTDDPEIDTTEFEELVAQARAQLEDARSVATDDEQRVNWPTNWMPV